MLRQYIYNSHRSDKIFPETHDKKQAIKSLGAQNRLCRLPTQATYCHSVWSFLVYKQQWTQC